MSALPAQRVEMIPVDRVTVINPRSRNKKAFKEIIDNIARIGLKKPITVTRRMEAGGPFYDLVCGQGRLEAYIALGQSEVPALVVTADQEDCLVASLVENCARRQHRAIDLLQDIRGMEERGYSAAEIARKTGLTVEYVHGVARLIEKGEQRLLRSVESGVIPLSVAVEIAEAPEQEVQAALSSAYERGLLKGKKLLVARKIIENRRRRGKGLAATDEKSLERVSADTLVFSMGYVKSIVAATPPDQLVEGKRSVRGLTPEQVALMTEEADQLDREFRLIEQSYGADHLDLVLAAAYVSNLLDNARVVRHLAQFHADLLQEFQKIAEIQKAA